MNLTQYIADLLLRNNCVIVPEFGGFISNYHPAVVDELHQKIYPPSKQVLFNVNLNSNDGLLANFVANKINTTYPNALKLIKADVEFWKTNLKKGSRINIGEIGFLYYDNHQIKFEQNKSYNLLLSAYGLSEIKFLPSNKVDEPVVSKSKEKTLKVTTKAKPIRPSTLEKVVSKVETKPNLKKQRAEAKVVILAPKKRKKNWKYIAIACAMPLLFYSYWIPLNTNVLETGNIKSSDFNPFAQQVEKIYTKRSSLLTQVKSKSVKTWEQLTEKINPSVKVYNYQFSDDLYIPVLLSHTNNQEEIIAESKKNDEIKTNDTKVNHKKQSKQNIHLISGCFSDKQNAESLVEELKLKGYDAHIVDKNKGLYRVAAQSFTLQSDAKSFKDKLSSDGYSSWVLKK